MRFKSGVGRWTAACLLLVIAPIAGAQWNGLKPADAADPNWGHHLDAYRGDWGKLPLGNTTGKWSGNLKDLKDVDGADLRKSWDTSDEVVIRGVHARVHWATESKKKQTTLFLVNNAKRVIIDDVAIVATDPDARMYDTIRIQNADEVIIRNSYFAGSVKSYHLRIFGARRVLIDGVEVAGVPVAGGGNRLGGGIWIKNARAQNKKDEKKLDLGANPGSQDADAGEGAVGGGADEDGPRKRHGGGHRHKGDGGGGGGGGGGGDDEDKDDVQPPAQWKPSEWVQVQNVYLHDFDDTDQHRNQDAINIDSPGDGLIFNCVIENWGRERTVGDGGIDLSYRQRQDTGNRRFRVERNVFRHVTMTKSPAWGQDTNVVVWANNLYIDTPFTDGHGGWLNVLAHNTFIYSDFERPFRIWNKRENGRTIFESNAVFAAHPMKQVWSQTEEGVEGKLALMKVDRNFYAMPEPKEWLGGGPSREHASGAKDWKALGFDASSQIEAPESGCRDAFPDPGKGPGCPLPPLKALATGGVAAEQGITRDFWGRPRPATARAGAFEE